MRALADPPRMRDTGESAAERHARLHDLAGTPGEAYVLRRGVPVAVARAAGVRFDPGFDGRPAVVVAMRDARGPVRALHARYLAAGRREDKMRTVGERGGAVAVQGGLEAEPLILVEGLFDALSLATPGVPCVATIGRFAPWFAEAAAGRDVVLALDAGAPGEREAARLARALEAGGARAVRRVRPPGRSKDWSTALARRGAHVVAAHLRAALCR